MNRSDGSWMYEKRMLGGGLQSEFVAGVNEFLDFAFNHAHTWAEDTILCPCDRCTNRYKCTQDVVLRHLYSNGFMVNYYVWRQHGEDDNFVSHDPIGRAFDITPDSFRDLRVDVAEGYMSIDIHVFDPEGERATCDEALEQNQEAAAFFDLLDQEKKIFV